MVIVDQAAPAGIVDRLLWQDAQRMLGRHAEAGHDGNCVWCGWRWPCAPRRIAERADAASRRPWREAWTLRHDLNSMRDIPGVFDDNRVRRETRKNDDLNRGRFD
ncbi:hypothetical protein [Actinoplanes sp. NPDC049681]|uniref:hypothetical protein n=1 Tax=Actinoplanes sp. NPDC049681 TaxID=3363905 RepID=UPI0037AECED4